MSLTHPFHMGRWFGIVVLMTCANCAALAKSRTAGQIGCPAEAVEITDYSVGFFSNTWTATCGGRTYYCSQSGGGSVTIPQSGTYYAPSQVSCTERHTSEPTVASTPPSGCQHDASCKGSRVCQAGRCVDPGGVPSESPSTEFSYSAASSALSTATDSARECQPTGTTGGNATVKVTFATTGDIVFIDVGGASFAGTPTASCIERSFRKARVPPFRGEPVTLTKTVVFVPQPRF